MSTTELAKKAQACVDKQAPIPGAPLWHLGKAAKWGSKEDLAIIQDAIDYLTCKAQAQLPFSADEKEFLKELFEALWWGGIYTGRREAGRLADHYVNGGGKFFSLDAEIYSSSVIVVDAMTALKRHMADMQAAGLNISFLRSTDPGFRQSAHFRSLLIGGPPPRIPATQGYAHATGVLLVEQQNKRLKYCDHQFALDAYSSLLPDGRVSTSWRVESLYDFEPFSRADYITELDLSANMVVKLPDGLSHYMETIGVAKSFRYGATWMEAWTPDTQ